MEENQGIAARFAKDIQHIGIRVKLFRKSRKMSQRELARLSEVSSNSLSKIEKGTTNATIATFLALAKTLEVDVMEFFDYRYPQQRTSGVRPQQKKH